MITERCTNPDDGYSGLTPLAATARLVRRVEFISRRQRGLQPHISSDALKQAVDEVIVDYAAAGHRRNERTEAAIEEAMRIIDMTTPDPWATRAAVVVP